MLRTEQHELLIHGLETDGIELGFKAKMADAAFELEDFELGVGQHQARRNGRPVSLEFWWAICPSRHSV